MFYHRIEDHGVEIFWADIESQDVALYEKANLSPEESKWFESFSSDLRKIEWLQVRALLNEIFNQKVKIIYLKNGQPYLPDYPNYEISISHSKTIVAVALSTGFKVGVDVEQIHPRLIKVAERFLNATEQVLYNSLSTLIEKLQFLTIVWSAKESLFKIIGSEVDYKKDICVQSFSPKQDGTAIVEYFKDDMHRRFLATYKTIESTSILLWMKEKKLE